jgi:hypothetical protein
MESEGDEQNGTREENNELEANPTHSSPVQGSDRGRAQGEAPGENRKTK